MEPEDRDKSGKENAETEKDHADRDNNDRPDKDDGADNEKGKKDKDTGKKDKPGGKDGNRNPGKSGGPKGLSLPSMPAPQGGAAAAAGAGILGGILGGGKAAGPPAASTAAAVSTAAAAAPAPEPLFSEGKGPKIAVLDFEGEGGAEFAALLSDALKPGMKVYSRAALAAKNIAPAVNRVSARKIGAALGVDYLAAGKISKKTETLTIISVYLRSAVTGDINATESIPVRAPDTPQGKTREVAGRIAKKL